MSVSLEWKPQNGLVSMPNACATQFYYMDITCLCLYQILLKVLVPEKQVYTLRMNLIKPVGYIYLWIVGDCYWWWKWFGFAFDSIQ